MDDSVAFQSAVLDLLIAIYVIVIEQKEIKSCKSLEIWYGKKPG